MDRVRAVDAVEADGADAAVEEEREGHESDDNAESRSDVHRGELICM
jgi:hypothetical protein